MREEGKSRRPYTSRVREESARRTRAAITAAAARLFVTEGYAATSFDAVAREAGVARPTVVTAFGTKAALLSRVLDEALAGDDALVPVRDRPWFAPVWEATTAPAVLDAYAEVCLLIARRAAAVVEALHRAADSDPGTEALWESWLRGRRAGAAMVVEREVVLSALRDDLDVTTAGDVLWTLNDPGLYTLLVVRSGWTAERYRTWLATHMQAALLR